VDAVRADKRLVPAACVAIDIVRKAEDRSRERNR
jgi:hypothetical protein